MYQNCGQNSVCEYAVWHMLGFCLFVCLFISHWLFTYVQRSYEELNKDVSSYNEEMVYNWKSDTFVPVFVWHADKILRSKL